MPRGSQRSVTNAPKYARSHVEGRSWHARALFLSSWSRGAASPQPWKPENRSSVSHLRTRQGRRPQKIHPHTACLAGHAQTIGSANKMGTGTQNSPKTRAPTNTRTRQKKGTRGGESRLHTYKPLQGPRQPSWPAALGLSYMQDRTPTDRDSSCGGWGDSILICREKKERGRKAQNRPRPFQGKICGHDKDRLVVVPHLTVGHGEASV